MKTKKALGGLFGLLGSLAAFFVCFLPVPAPLRFNLNHKKPQKSAKKIESKTGSNKSDLKPKNQNQKT
jgi:hypothetical protein